MVAACHKNLAPAEEHIKEQLAFADVLHVDETGTRLNGKNIWLHTAGNHLYTHYAAHQKRGEQATREIDILPQFSGIAVHDFWKPYFKYSGCNHALCNVHILRELNGIIDNTGQQWAQDMKKLLLNQNQSG